MNEKIPEELKEIVLWKLEATVPSDFKLSVGDKGTFTKEELKKHVEQEDEIGVMFAEMQLSFTKALSSGKFSKTIAE